VVHEAHTGSKGVPLAARAAAEVWAESGGLGLAGATPLCSTCGEVFESRNKLMAHLKATGHAALKEAGGGGGKKGKRR
jgi:hypothetical protein